ncbi:hypothetical protein BABINDRAFT_162395 [Babjeviella inositovora NRRL Y-12698]|uniref:Transcription activator GCR1-like domain-containing protein n=1 Tax=Babjeviella inositovora NRRL Y-12698 TaxID=984486 RepID=A0A1E3QMK2_9ASCO|nr:uncharacterized protein BABINDRAFT_162395 [Babjeviella inositovora NRRL Y-12698]ODQ78694.1 hypothetical protein BABINDRAFT_162395 [Babjeviella inositovora NRRL Y-12698]
MARKAKRKVNQKKPQATVEGSSPVSENKSLTAEDDVAPNSPTLSESDAASDLVDTFQPPSSATTVEAVVSDNSVGNKVDEGDVDNETVNSGKVAVNDETESAANESDVDADIDISLMELLPVKTLNAYNAGIEKYIEWSQSIYPDDAFFDKVTGEKAFLWLRHIAAEGKTSKLGATVPYSRSTLIHYLAGINLVYKRQIAEEIERTGDASVAWDPPRTPEVKEFLKNYGKSSQLNSVHGATPQSDELDASPRAIPPSTPPRNTLAVKRDLDDRYNGLTYSHAELKRIVHHGFVRKNPSSVLALLLARNLAYPLSKLRYIELADIRVSEPTAPFGTVLAIAKNGYVTGCVRHAEVEVCPHFAMAQAAVRRWGDAKIDFAVRGKFAGLKLFAARGSDGFQPVYATHHKSTLTKLMDGAGVGPYNVTYAGLWAAAQACRARGIPEGVIEEFIHWSAPEASLETYLADVVPEPLLALGGYATDAQETCTRDSVVPPDSLVHAVFPHLQAWRDVLAGSSSFQNHFQGATLDDVLETARMAKDAIRTLDYLARVFIEDWKFLPAKYRQEKHPVFATEAYARFRREQDAFFPANGTAVASGPFTISTMADVNEYFGYLVEENKSLRVALESLTKRVDQMSRLVQDSSDSDELAEESEDDAPFVPPPKRRRKEAVTVKHDFVFKRSPADMREVYREFTESTDGVPCPLDLEEQHGNAWRGASSSTTSQYFCRRRKVYNIVQNGIRNGLSVDEAIDALEAHYLTSGLPLLIFISGRITDASLPKALRS